MINEESTESMKIFNRIPNGESTKIVETQTWDSANITNYGALSSYLD